MTPGGRDWPTASRKESGMGIMDKIKEEARELAEKGKELAEAQGRELLAEGKQMLAAKAEELKNQAGQKVAGLVEDQKKKLAGKLPAGFKK